MKVIQLVSNKVWGGGERYALDITERLLQDGHEVTVVTRGSEVVDIPFLNLGVKVLHAPFGGFTDMRTPRIIADFIGGISDCEGGKIIIHAHDFKNAWLAVRAKKLLRKRCPVKVVVTRHLVKPGKNDIINRYIYRHVDDIIFISNIVREVFLSTDPHVAPGKLHTVYNSILNPPMHDKTVVETEKNIDGIGKNTGKTGNATESGRRYTPRILFIGRLSKEKGVELLLEALSILKDQDWRLVIGGTGDSAYVESLRTHAERLKISDKIEWLGYVSDIWPVIRSADIGVVPSIVPEAFGLAILEFLSQGVPVVSTDTGAQREILTHGHDGLLTAPTPASFASALSGLISDPKTLDEMGENALHTYSRFSYDTFYSHLLRIYRK